MFTILISCCRQNNWWKQRRYCCGPIPSLSGTNTSLLSYLFVISTNRMEFMSLFLKSNLWLISYLLFKLINSSLYSSSVFDWVPLLFFFIWSSPCMPCNVYITRISMKSSLQRFVNDVNRKILIWWKPLESTAIGSQFLGHEFYLVRISWTQDVFNRNVWH